MEHAIFAPVSLMFLIAGAALAIFLLRQRTGRDELRLDAEAIRSIWRVGPVSWSKTIPRSKTAQLTVVRRSLHGHGTAGEELRDYHVLVAEDETGRRRNLVANYPRRMLLALALELSSRWKALAIDPDLVGIGVGKLAVAEDTEIPTDIRERFQPPRGTRLIFERVDKRGVRITKPPDGFFNAGVFVLLSLSVASLGLASTHAMSAMLGANEGDLLIVRFLIWVFVGLGILLGVVCLTVAVGIATSGFVLIATPDSPQAGDEWLVLGDVLQYLEEAGDRVDPHRHEDRL